MIRLTNTGEYKLTDRKRNTICMIYSPDTNKKINSSADATSKGASRFGSIFGGGFTGTALRRFSRNRNDNRRSTEKNGTRKSKKQQQKTNGKDAKTAAAKIENRNADKSIVHHAAPIYTNGADTNGNEVTTPKLWRPLYPVAPAPCVTKIDGENDWGNCAGENNGVAISNAITATGAPCAAANFSGEGEICYANQGPTSNLNNHTENYYDVHRETSSNRRDDRRPSRQRAGSSKRRHRRRSKSRTGSVITLVDSSSSASSSSASSSSSSEGDGRIFISKRKRKKKNKKGPVYDVRVRGNGRIKTGVLALLLLLPLGRRGSFPCSS